MDYTTKMVVTPHSGEFERLFGVKLELETDKRAAAVSKAASEHGVVALVKGPVDIVSDGERVALNDTHSPAMTVGGTGDVLTGVTAGLLAKGLEPFDAACCAVFINGSAGVLAAAEQGLHIAASDVLRHLPASMKPYDRLESPEMGPRQTAVLPRVHRKPRFYNCTSEGKGLKTTRTSPGVELSISENAWWGTDIDSVKGIRVAKRVRFRLVLHLHGRPHAAA